MAKAKAAAHGGTECSWAVLDDVRKNGKGEMIRRRNSRRLTLDGAIVIPLYDGWGEVSVAVGRDNQAYIWTSA